jgi:hypothetical protein
MYKLFLDDIRNPSHCVSYMSGRIGTKSAVYLDKDWIVARDYEEFVSTIEERGVPDLISFDHDLAAEHYNVEIIDGGLTDYNTLGEKTGYDCAKWLLNKCHEEGWGLPNYFVHSMNPVGSENIIQAFKAATQLL